MTNQPKNHGKDWTPPENRQLRELAAGNTPTRVIAIKMARTPAAIASHAHEISVSLKPTNPRPYGTAGRRRG